MDDIENNGKALYAAAEENDLMRLENLLVQGADVNSKNFVGMTPLHIAALKNVGQSHFQVIEKLLKNGAFVNARDGVNRTPIYLLLQKSNVEVIKLLLNFKADINIVYFAKESLLFLAVENYKNVEVLQMLVDLGLDVNHRCQKGNTPLLIAAIHDQNDSHFEIIELLLKNGADANVQDDVGRTPLSFLVQKNNLKSVKLLLSFNADVKVASSQGETLLSLALDYNKNFEIVKLLTDLGLDVNHRKKDGKTPLHLATSKNEDESYFEIIETLLRSGAEVNARDNNGLTPIWYLMKKSTAKIVRLFLGFSADLSIIDDDRETLLFKAVSDCEDHEVVELLIEQGLDVNHRNKYGRIALHCAAFISESESSLKIIEILIKKGADVNARDNEGLTPFHILVKKNNLKTVRLFINSKADYNAVGNAKDTLLFHALEYNKNVEIVQLLLFLGLDVNHRSISDQTPLHIVMIKNTQNSHANLAEILLKSGAEVDAQDEQGMTPLHLLVEKCDLSTLQLLLSFDANVNLVDKYERNILFPAVYNKGHTEVMQVLINHGLDVNHRCKNNKTPLHLAAQCDKNDSHFNLIEILLKNGADVNSRDGEGRTAFYYLKEKATLKMVQLFLKFKTDFNFVDDDGQTLLFPAVRNVKHPEVLQVLIDLGLDVNHRCRNGTTPLHEAARCNKKDSHYIPTEILLKNGADFNLQDNYGKTAFYNFIKNACTFKMVQLFFNFNADTNFVDNYGRTMLFLAARFSKDVEIVQLLVNLGSDINYRNLEEETPLHWACMNKNEKAIKIIKFFVKNEANLNAIDKRGLLPIELIQLEWTFLMNKKINFILEHTDINVFYKNYNFSKVQNYHLDTFWKCNLENLAKQQSLNIVVDPSFSKIILENRKLNVYFEQCQSELLRAKNTKLQKSWITFYNLLLDSKKKVKNYAGNEDLIEELQNFDYQRKFPIYGFLMNENVKKGLRRRKLFDKSSILLSNFLPIFNSNHLIIRDVFDCILSKKNLFNFCKSKF